MSGYVCALNGLYVGQLSDDELLEFERMVADGRAVRSYSGAAGLMGLAKVKVIDAGQSTSAALSTQEKSK